MKPPVPKVELLFSPEGPSAVVTPDGAPAWPPFKMTRTIYCEPLDALQSALRDYLDGKVGAEGPPAGQMLHWRHHSIVGKPGLCPWCPEPRQREIYKSEARPATGKVQIRRDAPGAKPLEDDWSGIKRAKIRGEASELTMEDLL